MPTMKLIAVAVVVATVAGMPSARGECQEWPLAGDRPACFSTRAVLIDNWHAIAAGPELTLGVGVYRTSYEIQPYLAAFGPIDAYLPQLGSLRLPAVGRQVCLNGEFAYLTAGTAELTIIDVSNPAAMVIAHTRPLGGPCRDLVLDPDRGMLITAEWDAVRFYDTVEPDRPELVASVPAAGAWAVVRRDSTVFVACANAGLRIIDVADYASPYEIANLPVGGNVRDVAVWGDQALLVGPTIGLVTVDISEPTSPSPAYQVPCAGDATQILVHQGFAYVRAEQVDSYPLVLENLQLFQLFATRAPRLRGSYFTGPDLGVIAAAADRLLFGYDEDIMVCLMQCGPVAAAPRPGGGPPDLHPARPNPFNPRTTIGFTLPGRMAVSLRVYDAAGRLVTGLLTGETLPAGRHDAIWNGRDREDRAVPSGVYFYRLDAGASSATGSVVLVR